MKKRRISIIQYILIIIISLFFAFPIIWIFVTSFKLPVDATNFWHFSNPPRLSNYVDAWKNSGFARSFFNTLVISIVTVAISIFAGFLMAYALLRSPISNKMKKLFST